MVYEDESKNNDGKLPGGADLWISRVAGGGLSGLIIAAIIICLPSLNTYFADSKEIRILEIKTQSEQCSQQLLSCISDLKEARADYRSCRKEDK